MCRIDGLQSENNRIKIIILTIITVIIIIIIVIIIIAILIIITITIIIIIIIIIKSFIESMVTTNVRAYNVQTLNYTKNNSSY